MQKCAFFSAIFPFCGYPHLFDPPFGSYSYEGLVAVTSIAIVIKTSMVPNVSEPNHLIKTFKIFWFRMEFGLQSSFLKPLLDLIPPPPNQMKPLNGLIYGGPCVVKYRHGSPGTYLLQWVSE